MVSATFPKIGHRLIDVGTFTFSNGTSSTSATQVICYRDPAYTQWWYITLPAWTLFFMVPILAFGLGIWFRADYRSRDMAVMVGVASAGYTVYYFVKQVSFGRWGVVALFDWFSAIAQSN
jgi:hypothetical protein